MAGEKILSETQCKNAKPKANVYYLNDGAGLRLRCRPDGSRTWVFRYRVNAKEKALGLGSYFQISSEKRNRHRMPSKSLIVNYKFTIIKI